MPEYISFEEQINKDKEKYDEALKESSVDWHEGKNDYIPFMGSPLFALLRRYQELDKRFPTLRGGKAGKPERIEQAVLAFLLPISKVDIAYLLLDVGVTTIEAVLNKMMNEGRKNREERVDQRRQIFENIRTWKRYST